MRIAIVDESASRAVVIGEGLAALDDCENFVVTDRRGLVARIDDIGPDIVLLDLSGAVRMAAARLYPALRFCGLAHCRHIGHLDVCVKQRDAEAARVWISHRIP
jgi:hypothetical protein